MNRDVLPVVLLVLDGWGIAPESESNAISCSKAENLAALHKAFPSTTLAASGEHVGLPDGQIGNSEVGHLNLGAGRVVVQDLVRITQAVKEGLLIRHELLVQTLDSAIGRGKSVHFMGLFSPGGVHSHLDHLRGFVELAWERGAPKAYVHAFLDGRDVPPKSALDWMPDFEADLDGMGMAKIATVQGRFYAMDRDKRWERTERAWRALVHGEGHTAGSAVEAIEEAYERGETDEFVEPTVMTRSNGAPVGLVKDGDVVIHFNFRADRARQLTRALALDEFDGFEREGRPKLNSFACMTEYDKTFGLPTLFPREAPRKVFGEIIAGAGLKQLRMAETEKYAHVTYFFNGGREDAFDGEERILVPSTREVPTYDHHPEMSAEALTERALEKITGGGFDFMLMNFANPDMVGHTGVLDAAISACRVVDGCIGRIAEAVKSAGGTLIVTADHGNCEQMHDPETNGPHTAHTTNRVPCVIVSSVLEGRSLREGGQLADIAPTLLSLMGIDIPPEMEGKSLLEG